MRSKIFMLAIAAGLAVTTSAQAVLTLEFWHGVQTNTFAAGPPSSISGLRAWNLSSPGGQGPLAALNSGTFTLNSGTQYIIKIVLRDHDNIGGGAGFSISNSPDNDPNAGTATTNSEGLNLYAFRFSTTNSAALSGTADTTQNAQAPTATIWTGGVASTATSENQNYAIIDNPTASAFTMGSNALGLTVAINNHTDAGGNAAFNPTATDVLYPLANLLLTVNGPGAGQLKLARATGTNPPNFATFYTDNASVSHPVNLDTLVWGAGLNGEYNLPFTVVPEPSSMVLAGLAFSGLGYRLRRKFFGKKAAAE